MTVSIPIKRAINSWLNSQQLGVIEQLNPVAGGCICRNYCLRTTSGERLFLKTKDTGPARLFSCEARGLENLKASTSLRVPAVYHVADRFLILEYIEPGTPTEYYWRRLAEGLAEQHGLEQPCFGFYEDNFCGETPQENTRSDSGHAFFARHRLRVQGRLALHAGLLTAADIDQLERVIAKLHQWIPIQAPALVHGDLWGGNLLCDSRGEPVLIDPACHWGWRETDIAMMQLFGALPAVFYRYYQQSLPMVPDWDRRMPLYNLYHLLNHLNLFGSSYYAQVHAVIRQFA